MTTHALSVLGLVFTGLTLYGGPAELALVAAMKLPDAPNYSWTTGVEDDGRSYTIDGKTDRTGPNDLSLVNMPLVTAVRRSAGRGATSTENQVNAVFKGSEKLVIEVEGHWKTLDELKESSLGSGPGSRGRGRGGMGGYGGRGGPGGRGRRGMGGGENQPPGFSNLQLTLSRPHEEVAVLVASHVELKAEGDVVSGTLTETGAKLLLVHEGQKEITPLQASGTFRLWIKEGQLVKYEVKLEGTLAISTSSGRREVTVHQVSTTLLKDVGTTTFEVPEEARKKLGV